MNSTNLLLGSTGFLLLVAFVFSFSQLNKGRTTNSGEIQALTQEIRRLETEKELLEKRQRQSPNNLIFTSSPYQAPVEVVASDDTEAKMKELQAQLDLLSEDNSSLRDEVARANTPAPDLTEELTEEEELTTEEIPTEDTEFAERRARLIRNAFLQATVEAWDPEYWTIAIDPAARANFSVGDELAVRRNDGILCTFTVTNQIGSQFVGDLKSNLAPGAPEVLPGDELIIPPAFDRKLDY